jgi:sugar O-acyltransferase (sialic acid O-acetyltransferase NeuD family)
VRAPLLLVGASGLGRETAEAVRAGDEWDLVGWADDDPTLWGTAVDGLPVLGSPEVLLEHERWSAVLCPGSGRARRRIADRLAGLGLAQERYATVVHPTAVTPGSCQIGTGSILLAGTVLTASVELGRHGVLMPGVVLTHDDVLGDHVTVCARVALAGGVAVGDGAYLGTGCSVRENLSVGAWSTVGMGSVVLRDVPPHEVWAGVPARRLRSAQQDETAGARRLPQDGGPVAVVEGNRT